MGGLFSRAGQPSVTIAPEPSVKPEAITDRFCCRNDKLRNRLVTNQNLVRARYGDTCRPCSDTVSAFQKTKEQRIAPLLPGLYPPPGTSPNSSYCNCGHARLLQVACVTIGAACAA
jgi:hypothetical protein